MNDVAGQRSVRKAAAALLMLAPLGTAAGCASAPRPTPDISPTAVAVPIDERITLPTTMGLAFKHPLPSNKIEHQVLYTVQQSVRAQLHAEYGPGAKDPLLSVYWSGAALTAIKHDVSGWSAKHQQPVGVLVVSNTTYSAPNSAGKATVSFCTNWRHVMRGDAKTHVVGPAVQKANTPGTFTTLTLARSGDGRWKVSNMTETAHSPKCAVSK